MQQQIKEVLELLNITFGSDLLGVYLFGSALVGGLQKYSDLDLFVVTNRAVTVEEKRSLVTNLLNVSGIYMKSTKLPLELTIVQKTAINPWHYPPHYEFQYGEWLRESFEKGVDDLSSVHEMPDLALIITQILLNSEVLYGPEARQILAPVPYHDFMQAMIHDLARLALDLENDTRNVLLTYARIWSTLATNEIRSKPAAAEWALNRLPAEYQPVMMRAKMICIGAQDEDWHDIQELIQPCAHFIVAEIDVQISSIDLNDPQKLIKLA